MAQTLPAPVLVWECMQRYDDQYHVRCVPERRDIDAPVLDAVRRTPQANEVLPDRSRDLRPVAQRSDAEVFAVDAWQVPLYALPLDGVFVIELLRSVLCGRAAACEIRYAAPEVRANGYARAAGGRRGL